MSEAEDNKRLFDLQLANFLSIGKTQKNLLLVLMSYLGLVWVYAFRASGDVSIQILGVSLHAEGFWPVTPAVLTVLSLAVVGAINAAAPTWAGLQKTSKMLKLPLEFYDFDTQKNVLDYFTFLTPHPEKRLETRNPKRRFSFGHFLYPSVLAGTLYTTYYSLRQLPTTHGYKTYVIGCMFVQAVFSFRIFWRAVCRFLRIRRHVFEA
jgi:hypothetical protein